MRQARIAVEPSLTFPEEFNNAFTNGDLDCQAVRGTIAKFALDERWLEIYLLSQEVIREVSILIDADNKVWVDWGGPGQVPLHPPSGSRIPFKLWIHTHPRGTAYWSLTDRRSLAVGSMILQCALVLGGDGFLKTEPTVNPEQTRLSDSGPLQGWSDEKVQLWCNEQQDNVRVRI